MKFSHKVFFSTLLIIALIFGVGNTMLLNSVFRSAMEREERVTLDENQMLRFSFGTAAASAVATAESYGMMDALSDGTIRRIGWTLESSNNCCIRISDAERGTLYVLFPGRTVLYAVGLLCGSGAKAVLSGESAGYHGDDPETKPLFDVLSTDDLGTDGIFRRCDAASVCLSDTAHA